MRGSKPRNEEKNDTKKRKVKTKTYNDEGNKSDTERRNYTQRKKKEGKLRSKKRKDWRNTKKETGKKERRMKGIKRNQIHKPGLTEKAVLCSTVHRCTSLRIFRPAAAWSSLASERPWIWPLLCCCRGCWRCSRTTGLHKFIARSACRLKSRHKINTPQQTADVRYVGTGTFKANTLKQFRVGLKF